MEKSKANYWNDISLDNLEKGKEKKEQNSEKTLNPLPKSTKRSRLERYIDILKVVAEAGPIKRTHILYRANLAWSELNTFLQNLEEAESVSKTITKNGVRYEITEIGKSILENYANVQSSLSNMDPEAQMNLKKFSNTNF